MSFIQYNEFQKRITSLAKKKFKHFAIIYKFNPSRMVFFKGTLHEGKKKSGRNLDKRNVIRVFFFPKKAILCFMKISLILLLRSQGGRDIVAHDILSLSTVPWNRQLGWNVPAFVGRDGKNCTGP